MCAEGTIDGVDATSGGINNSGDEYRSRDSWPRHWKVISLIQDLQGIPHVVLETADGAERRTLALEILHDPYRFQLVARADAAED